MIAQETHVITKTERSSKVKDYAAFIKFRLSLLVVFSAVIGFTIGSHENAQNDYWLKLSMLILGGFLVTGSSNGFNQIIERDTDKLMPRTQNRPLPKGTMSVNEAIFLASVLGVTGISILTWFMNPMSGLLGAAALLGYTLFYTPLKRATPFAVFVGAFPGAIPVLLGHVATTDGFGYIKYPALVLFAVQFVWQFPHFWAIAWVMDEDYKKAGFRMLPSGTRDRTSAFQTLVYTLFLLPISLTPVLFKISGTASAIIIVLAGVYFCWQAYVLYRDCTVKAARELMFGSFLYLPVVQLAILLG